MTTKTVYKGDTIPVDFTAQWDTGAAIDITSALIWVGVQAVGAGSPAFTIANAAAGGSDSLVETVSAAAGTFTAWLPKASTGNLVDGTTYRVGGVVQLATGQEYAAGVAEFKVAARLPQTLS